LAWKSEPEGKKSKKGSSKKHTVRQKKKKYLLKRSGEVPEEKGKN